MSSSRVRIPHPHVRVEPEILGGSPFVEGSRVPVRRLWAWHQGGLTVETLLKRYPQLGPARVLDALAFAYDNQDLVEEDLERERELMAQATDKTPTPIPAVVSPTGLREAGQNRGPAGGQQAGRRR